MTLTLIPIAGAALVDPRVGTPLMDDWTYAWSVEHVLATGELRVLDWSAHYPLAQIIWGALFARLFGLSFFVLRVSTLALSVIGLLAFFLTLRALGARPFSSALGALALFANPVVFVLSHSFMTDVPFLAVMNVAVLCYVLWAQRGQPVYLGVAGAVASASFLIRQIGAVLALVPVGYLVLCRISRAERRAPRCSEFLFLGLPFVSIGLTLWWIRDIHGATSKYLLKAEPLHDLLSAVPWSSPSVLWVYFGGMVHVLVHLGLVLWPLALGTLWRRGRGVLLVSSALLCAMTLMYLAHFGERPNVLEQGAVLSVQELGASRGLVAGEYASRQLPAWITGALFALSLISAMAILAALLARARQRSGRISQPATVLVINTVLQFLAIEGLWLYHDRYYLPLLPGLIALLLDGREPAPGAKAFILSGVLLFGAVSVSGTIDNFRFNRAVADSREWLLSQGVAPWQIDAGYALNGWWLYAHPENLPPGARPESDVAFVTSRKALPYVIAQSPMPSYEVLRVVTWPSLWAASNRIYVLRSM